VGEEGGRLKLLSAPNILKEATGSVQAVFLFRPCGHKTRRDYCPSLCLSDHKVVFELDQDGLVEVAAAEIRKIAIEKDRFATLLTDYLTASGVKSEDITKIKSDIIDGIEKSVKDGSYPDTPEKIRTLLGDKVTLEKCKIETSLLPGGQGAAAVTVNFGDKDFKGTAFFNSKSASSKTELSGNYSLKLNVSADEGNGEIIVTGDLYQTGLEAKSNCDIKVSVKDTEENINYLDFAMKGKSEVRTDQEVQIDVPVLTEFNSAEFEKFIKNTPKVVLDGKTLTFDTDPMVVNLESGKRVMVPLRNLAEALGCEVNWYSPDQINILRDDTVIIMYLKKRAYYVNGEEKQLDAVPYVIDQRTMVPLRFVAEEFGCGSKKLIAMNSSFQIKG